MRARATFIRTYDGGRVVIPNAELFTDTVVVNTAFDHRRLEYDTGIGYGDDVDRGRQREGRPADHAHVPASPKVADAIAQISRPNARPGDGE